MSTRFHEQLWPPVRWWLLATLAMVTVAVILWSAIPGAIAAVVGLVLLGGSAWALTAYASEVTVDDAGLRAGRATLPWPAIGAVRALDRAASQHLLGQGADPRAFLVLRGYVTSGVRVDVDDDEDPAPYWFISTRRPDELVATLNASQRDPMS